MSEPIDVTLVTARKRIEQARLRAQGLDLGNSARDILTALANEAEKLADYIDRPDLERVALHPALVDVGARPALAAVPDEDDLRYTFSMQAVVDRVRELADNDVVAYVEMTGGWVATVYAAARDRDTRDPILYRLGDEDWSRWPILAGPGSFDPSGGEDHVAHLDEFFIGPDVELVPAQDGPPYPPPPGEWTATREDDVDSLARRLIAAVRAWESGEIPREKGVSPWSGR